LLLGGIDEAGRGSVIGPLVIAGISFDPTGVESIRNEGITDSKKLSVQKRETLYTKILQSAVSVFVCKISPITIDNYVNYKKLNVLESRFMTIIADNLRADKIIIDACDVKPDRFKQSILKNLTSKSVKIYCFHKADTDNLIVSAASIIAKVTRDREIKKIEETLCKKIGSGYPSDPSTKLFLRNHLFDNENKKYIRFSWSPVKNMINECAQTKLF
jgi:ribonuclease HII